MIGGPGSFMTPIHERDQFKEATRTKLILEIAGRTPEPQVVPAQLRRILFLTRCDCMIENNISIDANKVMVFRSSGTGSVVATTIRTMAGSTAEVAAPSHRSVHRCVFRKLTAPPTAHSPACVDAGGACLSQSKRGAEAWVEAGINASHMAGSHHVSRVTSSLSFFEVLPFWRWSATHRSVSLSSWSSCAWE